LDVRIQATILVDHDYARPFLTTPQPGKVTCDGSTVGIPFGLGDVEAVVLRCHDLLAEKLTAVFPAVGDWRVGPGWACLRTFASDERFVIGKDPHAPRLFWVAGLGGHGVTAAWAVGRLAAQVLLERADPGPFDPRRFGGGA